MPFPLNHPPAMLPDDDADRFTQRELFDGPTALGRLTLRARSVFKRLSALRPDAR